MVEALKTIVLVLTFDDFEPGQWNSIIRSCKKLHHSCTQKMNIATICTLKKQLTPTLYLECSRGIYGVIRKKLSIETMYNNSDWIGLRIYWGVYKDTLNGHSINVFGALDEDHDIIQKYYGIVKSKKNPL